LPNKAEVLVLRSLDDTYGLVSSESPPYAIAAEYLDARPVYHLTVLDRNLVILTTEGGANRVYATDSVEFDEMASENRVIDTQGRSWTIEETRLAADFDTAQHLFRVSAHRAFWFGWYAQHPETVLIH